jgi:hypothetical protein
MSGGAYPGWNSMVEGIPFSGRNLPPKMMLNWKGISYPMNFNVTTAVLFGLPVDVARNHICRGALDSGAKYLVFWDEDVLRPPQSIRELVYRMEHTLDAAIIGGVVCLKAEPAEPMIFKGIGGGPFWDWRVGEFFEIAGIGMGNTIIRLEALKDIEEPWFKTVNDYAPLMEGIPATEQWTEDLYFCDKVRKTKKWKIYCDGALLCAHVDLATGKEYGLPPDSKPLRHLLIPPGEKKILDVGSGHNPLKTNEGPVVTFDLDESCKPDYRGDCRRLPFGTGEFDIVHSRHLLEQFPQDETDEILKELKRVLGPKGELRLTVANLDWIADQVKAGKVTGPVLNMIYGDNRKTAFTSKMLEERLKEIGLPKISFKSDGGDLSVIARAKRA